MWRRLKDDWSLSATIAGLLAVTISYAGPLVIFFQAAQAANIGGDILASWIWAVSIGSAIGSVLLSTLYRMPILLAWSIPGTALLVSLLPQMSLGEVVGAYLVAGVLSLIIGISGYFDKILKAIPQGVAAGMMTGILFQFGIGAFVSVSEMPILVLMMLAVYAIAKRMMPRYAIVWVLLSGLVGSFALGALTPVDIDFTLTVPVWVNPEWSWSAVMNLALPLVILNLTGQFLPGMALLKLNNYDISSKPIINTASILSVAIACFGGISIVLAAVTSAICMSDDCHPNKPKRYIGGVANGLFYLIGGLFAGSIVGIFEMLPAALVAALAGIALLGALLTNMSISMQNAHEKEAALITFLATASGMSIWGLSSVFWGVVIGIAAYFLLNLKLPKPAN